MKCTCGNPEFGFDCVCKWVKKNPGNIQFSCEFCGIYTASKPRCNKCEESSESNPTPVNPDNRTTDLLVD